MADSNSSSLAPLPPPPAAAAALEQALAACLSPDAAARAEGEQVAADATKKGSKAALLAAVGLHSASHHVRQLAFTLLKKNASKSWRRLGASSKAAITAAPLTALERDPEPGPRRAAAACAGSIAAQALPRNEWPALLPWAQAAVSSAEPARREAALDLLAQLVDVVPAVMTQHAPALVAAASSALAASAELPAATAPAEAFAAASRVSSAALALLASVVNGEPDAAAKNAVKAAFPVLIASADRALAAGVAAAAIPGSAVAASNAAAVVKSQAEDTFATACDVAGDIVDSGSSMMGQVPIADVVAWCLSHAKGGPCDSTPSLTTPPPAPPMPTPPRARGPPLLIIEALARARPKALAKAGHSAAAAVTTLCELIAEPVSTADGKNDVNAEEEENDDDEPGSGDSDDEGGDVPLSTLAAQALDVLALNLPSRAILPAALAFVGAAAAAQQPRARRAGMVVLLVIAEGCADGFRKGSEGSSSSRPLLADAIAAVSAGLRDATSPGVRSQAAYALGQLAEHCQPEISQHVAAALPAALDALAAASADDGTGIPLGRGAAQACYAIEVLLDAMEDEEEEEEEGGSGANGGSKTPPSSGVALVRSTLPSLVPSLVAVLARGSPETQHAALGALASAAVASGPAFAPHAPAVLPALSHFMQATGSSSAGSTSAGQEALRLRARATEAAGVVAACLGREGAGPLLNEMVPVMLAGFDLDDAELREYTHGALANVAALLGPGAAPLLPRAVPAALASLAADDGACGESDEEGDEEDDDDEKKEKKSPGGASHETLGSDEDEEDDDDDLSDEDSDDDSAILAVRTGIAGEKAAAAAALGAYAAAAGGAAMAPHAGEILVALKKATRHWHSDVREAAYGAMGEVAKAAGGKRERERERVFSFLKMERENQINPLYLKRQPTEMRQRERTRRKTTHFFVATSTPTTQTAAAGPPTPPGGTPPAAAQAAAAEVLPTLAHALKRDPDAAAAAAAGGAAAEVVEVVGAAAAPFADALGDAAGAVLAGTARALGNSAGSDSDDDSDGQAAHHHDADDDDDGEEEEERGDAEALLLGAAADILPALARALGAEAFSPVFDASHAALLSTRMGADQPDEVRAAAVGAFADVALALGPAAARHAAAAAPALLRELRSSNDLCRRNAAYAAGAAVSSAPEAFAPHARHLLEALAPLLNSASASSDPGVGDNAAGALARSLLALPAGSLPAEVVLPALLSRVRPEGAGCVGDPAEAEPIMRALAAVVGVVAGAAPPGVEPFVGRAAAALAAAAADADAPPPVRVAAARGLVAAASARPEVAGPLVAALPESVRSELEALAARGG